MIKCAVIRKMIAGSKLFGIFLLLAFVVGMVDLPKAWAGGATDAMKGTIDEVLRILNDKELKRIFWYSAR